MLNNFNFNIFISILKFKIIDLNKKISFMTDIYIYIYLRLFHDKNTLSMFHIWYCIPINSFTFLCKPFQE